MGDIWYQGDPQVVLCFLLGIYGVMVPTFYYGAHCLNTALFKYRLALYSVEALSALPASIWEDTLVALAFFYRLRKFYLQVNCAPACAEASQKANATLYCDITVEDSDSLPHSGAGLHDRSGIVYSFHCLNGASSLLKWRIRFQTLQHAGKLARWLSTTALLVLLSCYALDATPVQLFAYLAIFFAYPTLLIMRTAVEVWEAQQRHSLMLQELKLSISVRKVTG